MTHGTRARGEKSLGGRRLSLGKMTSDSDDESAQDSSERTEHTSRRSSCETEPIVRDPKRARYTLSDDALPRTAIGAAPVNLAMQSGPLGGNRGVTFLLHAGQSLENMQALLSPRQHHQAPQPLHLAPQQHEQAHMGMQWSPAGSILVPSSSLYRSAPMPATVARENGAAHWQNAPLQPLQPMQPAVTTESQCTRVALTNLLNPAEEQAPSVMDCWRRVGGAATSTVEGNGARLTNCEVALCKGARRHI